MKFIKVLKSSEVKYKLVNYDFEVMEKTFPNNYVFESHSQMGSDELNKIYNSDKDILNFIEKKYNLKNINWNKVMSSDSDILIYTTTFDVIKKHRKDSFGYDYLKLDDSTLPKYNFNPNNETFKAKLSVVIKTIGKEIQSAIQQPNKPKPTTMLPDNMQWAWDPDAADWVAVLKDNTNTTPPLYDPNNQNAATNTTTYMSNIKSASVINGEEDEDPLSVKLSDLFLSDSSLVDSYIKKEISCNDIIDILGIEIKNKNEYKEVCNYVKEFIEDNYMSTVKSAYKEIDGSFTLEQEKLFNNLWKLYENGNYSEYEKELKNMEGKDIIKFTNWIGFYGKDTYKQASNKSLSVLPKLLDKCWYGSGRNAGKYAEIGNWKVGLGGYDMGYEVYYKNTPIFSITPYNELKCYWSDDRLQEEFGFTYSDIENVLKSYKDLGDIKVIKASKKVESTSVDGLDFPIKTWYTHVFKQDKLGEEIDPNVTFQDVLDNPQNVYKLLGVGDSTIRERVFTEISRKTNKSGDDIYNRWLGQVKSSCLAKFLDGPQYSKEVKIEAGLIKDGLLKYAGFDFNRGTRYAITDKGLEILRKASETEHNEALNEREKLAYMFGFNTDKVSTLDTTGKVIKQSARKWTICEADGTELGEVEADSELDAKVKFGIEHPEYADSQSICAKEINAQYEQTTNTKEPYPNPSETPNDHIVLENHDGWVNTAKQKVTPEFSKLHKLLGEYKKQNLIQLSDLDGNLVASGDPQIINELEHQVKDIGYYCESVDENTDSDYAETYSLKIFMK